MVTDEEEVEISPGGTGNRRILKVRLRQDQVIRLHELRILRGQSIAALLEGILEDYFQKNEYSAPRFPHLMPSTAGTFAAKSAQPTNAAPGSSISGAGLGPKPPDPA